ncbi:MAG TPA: hypothetical protein VNG12_15225 [Acidimicrobiales bacterium]|nr:hypothetical protein [Acidimicrobiales bacterium]
MTSPALARLGTDNEIDGGAILMYVLVLLVFCSLGVVPALNAAVTNIRTTSTTQMMDNWFYATDGGVEYAIQALRADPILCPPTNTLVSISLAPNLRLAGALSPTVTAQCNWTAPSSGILNAVITSAEGGGGNLTFKAVASVNINTIDPSTGITIVSWSTAGP